MVLSVGLWACGSSSPEPAAPVAVENPVEAPVDTPEEPAEPAEPAAAVELTGTIIQKPWSKSVESWNAGGSEYYVLDVGDAEVAEKSAAEGVTIIATDSVTKEQLAALVGKTVTVTGLYVSAKPYEPSSPMEQYPQGMDGKPLPRGAGFAASAIAETP